MLRFLIRKMPSVALVVLVSSFIAFLLPRLAPGDPAVALAGSDATAQQVAAIRTEMGLDRALPLQYLDWIGGVLQGHLGQSYLLKRPVSALIASRLDSTVELTIVATVLMVAIGLTLGVAAGSPRSRWARGVLDVINTIFLATPPFLTGLLLILLLGVAFRVLPISGEASLLDNPVIGIQYLILPGLALALSQGAVVARLVQTAMLSARGEEYVDLATAKGVPPKRITRNYVLRNSLGTAVVAIGLRIGDLLAGAIVIEAIFARNGLGQLAVTSVQSRDYLVLQALILGAVLIAVAVQLVTEITLAALDPRIRLEG